MNRIVLIGRLTRDPEVRYTQSGIPVTNFSIAVDRKFKNASGERETDFINIVAWRKTAELVGEYLGKGRLVAVDGSLQQRKYQNREGENRTVYEVLADTVQFLDRGDRSESRSGSSSGYSSGPSDADAPPESYNYSENEPASESDLPF
jgi:single-strand DNA-binding protein